MAKNKPCVSCGTLTNSENLFCSRCKAAVEQKVKPFYEEDEKEEAPPEVKPSAKRRSEDLTPRKKKVLIIDDEVTITSALAVVLEEKNYEVMASPDGRDGLKKACEWHPDLIVLDVLMPKMTGYDFLQKLKEEKTGASSIPIIIISGREDMKSFFEPWDFFTFLSKPISLEEFLSAIDALLARKEAEGG